MTVGGAVVYVVVEDGVPVLYVLCVVVLVGGALVVYFVVLVGGAPVVYVVVEDGVAVEYVLCVVVEDGVAVEYVLCVVDAVVVPLLVLGHTQSPQSLQVPSQPSFQQNSPRFSFLRRHCLSLVHTSV